MTRRERHILFADSLHAWLRANVKSLSVPEVVGIMTCITTEMILDSNFEEVDSDDLDGGGESWKLTE